MGEKVVTRPWTQKDDDLLRDAVVKHGTQDNWQAVASEVSGRDNKACRKRWLHSLSPTVKKSPWTVEEDALLRYLHNMHGARWSLIAREIEGRTDDACSKRYNEALDPTLKRDEWTPDEEARLLQVYSEIGCKWKEIGSQLQRSSLACRNRFKVLQRKKKPATRVSSPTAAIQNELEPEASTSYYPPETFPSFFPEDVPTTFQEPTPEVLRAPSLPPFHYSSSSLSTALEERPPISRHSPHSEPMFMNVPYDFSPGTSATPSSFSFAQDFNDSMLLDNFSDLSHFTVDRNTLSTYYSHDNAYGLVPIHNGVCPAEPCQIAEYLPAIDTSNKLPQLEILSDPHDQHPLFNESPCSSGSPELSYPSSPLGQSGASSSTSSPGISASTELPSEPPPLQSLLFASIVIGSKESTSTRKHNQPTRLSSLLPFSDGSLRPYACGHVECWPVDASTSASCFPTARELLEHSKIHKEPEDERPYRCALPGCNKFWKSLNGLQYHLQLSSAHFQQALSKTFSSQGKSTLQTDSAEGGVDSDSPDHDSKRYVCDRPNCFKSYKNASGLRYHKRHGHPKTIPMQLDNVPPALARDLPSRTRKMRKKDHIQSAVYPLTQCP
ncbi:hypothetical protein GGU11DRAFT_746128 [Lentinula aff. detonsa]|uniref:Uncharacterized protein n=1 Tax=Lentinula aff. detonsa TaxID=2804958 RepID=A0AA38L5N5_9AGAR|nr:hypothetical protein GGU10DRAFT_138140 [Lentinula aff. detonsa]KAJ3796432.1 hypothetical protein GGU11DRAFT_746128 [Lentinula aff. detonsa]